MDYASAAAFEKPLFYVSSNVTAQFIGQVKKYKYNFKKPAQ